MNKDRIIFFANDGFAVNTFKCLVENGTNIVGLVTSAYNGIMVNALLNKIATTYHIPTYVVNNNVPIDKNKFFIDWLKRANADIFCVISFQKLPQCILRMAKKCAFGIHASLLPFLKGTAPINWAIRLGYKYTGLTACILTDEIDSGDIITNVKVKIKDDEKFTSLHQRLSYLCIDFTKHIIDDVLQKENWQDGLISMPSYNDELEYLQMANPINDDYFECYWTRWPAKRIKDLLNSVNNIGLPCNIKHSNIKGETYTFPIKIYEIEIVDDSTSLQIDGTESDGKTYIKIHLRDDSAICIKKLQIGDGEIMSVGDFLNSFHYFNSDILKDGSVTYIEPLISMEKFTI